MNLSPSTIIVFPAQPPTLAERLTHHAMVSRYHLRFGTRALSASEPNQQGDVVFIPDTALSR